MYIYELDGNFSTHIDFIVHIDAKYKVWRRKNLPSPIAANSVTFILSCFEYLSGI